MDFGIARAIADTSSAMTQTAAVIGTAQYLSPEQARGETVDARSDIYSTGCVLYELLTGRPPFVGDSPVSVAYQHVREEARPASQLNPDVSVSIDNILAKALAKRVDERYSSADEMRRDIDRVLGGMRVEAPAPATAVVPAATMADSAVASTPEPEEKRSSKAWWWALAVLVVAILVAVGFAFALGVFSNKTDVTKVAVPNVVGMDESSAGRALTNVGLKIGKSSTQASDTVSEGNVVSSDPASGTKIAEGSTVDIVVSSGPGDVSIPDLSGYTYDRAKALLESDQYGLVVQQELKVDATPAGQVINSDPPTGQQASRGSTVTLIVSQGQVTVPNVVGLSLSDATNQLQSAGLKVTSNTDSSSSKPAGQVTSQNPAAGSAVAPSTSVTVTVSAGPSTSPSASASTSTASATP
jgi:eukaryotic-like serine/threonine-protein kinase